MKCRLCSEDQVEAWSHIETRECRETVLCGAVIRARRVRLTAQTVKALLLRMESSVSHAKQSQHRLRCSGSTVVTMTSKVSGKMEILTPCRSETP